MTELGAGPEQQPYSPAPYFPPPVPRARWHRPAVVGAVLCAVATALILVGSFAPLFSADSTGSNGVGVSMSITAWDFDVTAIGTTQPTTRAGAVPTNGVALVLAAAILFSAALLGVVAGSQPANASARRLSGVASVAGAAFAAGTTVTVAMQVSSWFDSFRPFGTLATGPSSTDLGVGFGFWLVVVGAVVAVGAAAFAWRSPRVTTIPAYYGFPVVNQLPDNPVPQ